MKTFIVTFELGSGWRIQCDMRGFDEDHAVQLAKVALHKRFPQWRGGDFQVSATEKPFTLQHDVRFADPPIAKVGK